MSRRSLALSLVLAMSLMALPLAAHVTPNVQLLKKGRFIAHALVGASRFFERHLKLDAADRKVLEKETGWVPSSDDTKIYTGRTKDGTLVGTAVFLWMPSEHGPVGVGVAFDPRGKILDAAVTDVGSEPLAWVQPLIDAGGLSAFKGLAEDATPDPGAIAPAVKGRMSRYYAKVIADAVARAQAVEELSRKAAAGK
ncbi:MAG TPA: hypothetical protein VKA53_11435 [Thermoanaerobaculia bacterium]|nr:hypothetical protein [Thermoanaerobaculia bacterium]